MMRTNQSWTLEQNDRRIVYGSGAEAAMFAESSAFGVAQHRLPAWKVVLPIGGHAELVRTGQPPVTAAGLIVPPQLAHSCAAASPYVALFVDSWLLPPAPGPIRLDVTDVRRIVSVLGATDEDGIAATADLTAGYAELRTLTEAPSPLDSRVTHALTLSTRLEPGTSITTIAAEVGLSAPRLRALVRQTVGIPLGRLRQWARLRAAIAELPGTTVAMAAATAGFADQAHFSRTARGLIGRTPASLRPRGSAQPSW